MPQAVIGCDLSRALIDICELPSGRIGQIANTPDAITTWLDALDHDIRLVFEATSGCDDDLIAALATRRIPPRASIRVRRGSSYGSGEGRIAVIG
ncbi:hypothetical protein RN629_14970 [Sphingomonadaceae bacterium jetA1]|jgi:transposase|uniref:hypothetical protein n=1 Tax=Facivitalis istanbulensis TaxID=3075838 RepID=UPI00349358EF